MRRALWWFAALLAAAPGCRERAPGPGSATSAMPPVTYEEITRPAGIDFRHHNGATGKKYLPETMGSGCAFVDFDNDGWLDILLVDATPWPEDRRREARPGRTRLYRNLGTAGRVEEWKSGRVEDVGSSTLPLFHSSTPGLIRFQDVTQECGLPAGLYGMGVAAGDYDNDGFTDLFLTALGESCLLRNVGGQSFEDRTARAEIRTPGWPTGAAFLDYNRDGLLDLFVCHYVGWSPETDRFFSLDGLHKSYARPDQYPGEPCQLFENRGGRFVDVSRRAGIALANTKALGVALCDFDRDGWVDLAVSNDTVPNFLFHNQGNGTFKEAAMQAGIAVSEAGRAKAGMGIDAADYDNSGRTSILISNFSGEQLTLYRQDETGLFMDVAAAAGIGAPSQRFLGFGTLFFDTDLDGWQDVFVANGHIQDDVALRSSGVTYAEPSLLFQGNGRGGFRDASSAAGALATPRVARGAACGDVDNDGDLDLLVTTNGGAAALLRNAGPPRGNWLRLRLEGRNGNRSAIGATVQVRTGDQVQSRMVRSGGSYLSQSALALTFGLGRASRADAVEVRWPGGAVESFGALAAGQEVRLVEGSGG